MYISEQLSKFVNQVPITDLDSITVYCSYAVMYVTTVSGLTHTRPQAPTLAHTHTRAAVGN